SACPWEHRPVAGLAAAARFLTVLTSSGITPALQPPALLGSRQEVQAGKQIPVPPQQSAAAQKEPVGQSLLQAQRLKTHWREQHSAPPLHARPLAVQHWPRR